MALVYTFVYNSAGRYDYLEAVMNLGYPSYSKFLSTQPHWDGTDERDPLAIEAAIELSSPMSHGMPLGKVSYLEAILLRGYRPTDAGDGANDPIAAYLRNKRTAAARMISNAKERLGRNPRQFITLSWQSRQDDLPPQGWSVFLDTIYAAHVITLAADATNEDIVRIAGAARHTLYSGVRVVADLLLPDQAGWGNPLLGRIEAEAFDAAHAIKANNS